MKKYHLYRCAKCGKVVERLSTKAWIKSWCESTGKDVRVYRVRRGK